jgi:hypothetical protein
LACPVKQATFSEVAAGMCVGFVFLMRRKERAKHAKHFWTQRLFNDGFQHGNNLLQELNIEDDLGILNIFHRIWGWFRISVTQFLNHICMNHR